MPLLDTMLKTGRFNEFVQEIIRIKNDENEEGTADKTNEEEADS